VTIQRRSFLATLLAPTMVWFLPKIRCGYVPKQPKMILLECELVWYREVWQKDKAPFVELFIPESYPWDTEV